MDLSHLGAAVTANRVPLLAAAGVGVGGLAYMRKKKAAAAAAGAQPAQGVQTDAGVYSAGGQVAGMAGANAYDSSSSDVYGLLQPQLESLGGQLTSLTNKVNSIPIAAPPKPATTPTTKPTTPAAPKPAPKPVTKAPAPKPAPKPAPAPPHAAPPPPPVPVPHPAHAVDTWVTVNSGDSLSRIAARYPQQDITWQSIYKANQGTVGGNPNLIRPGEKLHIVG